MTSVGTRTWRHTTVFLWLVFFWSMIVLDTYGAYAQGPADAPPAQPSLGTDGNRSERGPDQPTGGLSPSPQQTQAAPVKVDPVWYRDPNTLTAVVALIISAAAWLTSHQSSKAQMLRQKREELRSLIERITEYRNEFNTKLSASNNDQDRNNLSVYLNTKKSICLESAEILANDLSKYVSAAELIVLGNENWFESDFAQARQFYVRAVKASMKSSPTVKAMSYRVLAGSYFIQPPFQDIKEGRKNFQHSVDVLKNDVEIRKDPYSTHIQNLNYREWSRFEIGVNNFEKAKILLSEAMKHAQALPEWYGGKIAEIRFNATTYMYLANSIFEHGNIGDARETFKIIFTIIDEYHDDYNVDLKAQIYQEWGRREASKGNHNIALDLLKRAKEQYELLPQNYLHRREKISFVERLMDKASTGVGASNA